MIDQTNDRTKDLITFNLLEKSPLLFVISGPSGVGKDAVVKSLIRKNPHLHFVITATSRPPRVNEVDGVDYFFVSKDQFEEMIENDELIEYANVYDQYKGVPKAQVREALASGKDVIMRLDVQGAKKVHELCPNSILIFLAPTNQEEWLKRLKNRNTETDNDLRVRLETIKKELTYLPLFDYVVYNPENCLEQAVYNLQEIIEVEHLRNKHREITL